MEFTRRTCSEVGEDCAIGRKVMTTIFTSYVPHQLPGLGHNDHNAVLCGIIRTTPRRIAKITAALGLLFYSQS